MSLIWLFQSGTLCYKLKPFIATNAYSVMFVICGCASSCSLQTPPCVYRPSRARAAALCHITTLTAMVISTDPVIAGGGLADCVSQQLERGVRGIRGCNKVIHLFNKSMRSITVLWPLLILVIITAAGKRLCDARGDFVSINGIPKVSYPERTKSCCSIERLMTFKGTLWRFWPAGVIGLWYLLGFKVDPIQSSKNHS